MKPCVRFAPSPTGEPHLGFARTALYNFLFARNKGGEFLLRVEDTDLERSKKEYIDQIINSLKWLGIEWDREIIFQSNRSHHYDKHLKSLLDSGKVYRCFASKNELEQIRKETGSFNYNGLWRDRSDEEISKQLDLGIPYTIRLKTPKSGVVKFKDMVYGDISVSNSEIDDFIIVRSDGSPVYNFTNVIDDQDMGITHVIRGEDHISNTPKQIQIYLALGWKLPKFAHLPMILGIDKKRLSKRHGATSVTSYRDEGYQPEALINYLALLGWNPGTDEEIMDLSQLISKFDFSRVQKKSAVFDPKKLGWVSSKYLEVQEPGKILKSIRMLDPDWGDSKGEDFCIRVINMLTSRSQIPTDIIENSDYFFKDPQNFSRDDIKKIWKDTTQSIIEKIIQIYSNANSWSEKNLEKIFKNYVAKTGLGFGQVMKPIRLALCGSLTGPSLFELMELIGKTSTINRLNNAIKEIRTNE